MAPQNRMRGTRFLILLSLTLLAGCAAPGPDPCEVLDADLVVDEVHENSLLVDEGALVLHTSGSEVLLREGGHCTTIATADVRPGDRVGHDATEVADSYPMQAWPDTVVVERPRP